jgi:hypothetical protein
LNVSPKLNRRSLEDYVRKADEIAVNALVFAQNVDQAVIEHCGGLRIVVVSRHD